MEEPKKRLRGKQPVGAYAAETPAPKKRLRGKQKAAEFPIMAKAASPKLAKAKARVKKGEPKDQQFTDVLKKHFKQNAGAINLAERVKKAPGKGTRGSQGSRGCTRRLLQDARERA